MKHENFLGPSHGPIPERASGNGEIQAGVYTPDTQVNKSPEYHLDFLEKVKHELWLMMDANDIYDEGEDEKIGIDKYFEILQSEGFMDLDNDVQEFMRSVTPKEFEELMNKVQN